MSKKIKKTDEQIKLDIAHDIQMYKDAGMTVEDYCLDYERVTGRYAYNQGFNFGYIFLGITGIIAGVAGYFLDKRDYHKKTRQMNDNLNHRINERRRSVMDVGLNDDIITSDALDEQIDDMCNVDVNVDI